MLKTQATYRAFRTSAWPPAVPSKADQCVPGGHALRRAECPLIPFASQRKSLQTGKAVLASVNSPLEDGET